MPFTIQDILTLRSLPTESVGIFCLIKKLKWQFFIDIFF